MERDVGEVVRRQPALENPGESFIRLIEVRYKIDKIIRR
jgi:hypothetical protein